MSKRNCFVYWIHRPCESDIFTQGYVGVTVNPVSRFKSHLNTARNGVKNHKFYNALRKYSDFKFDVLIESDLNYCLELEHRLRPLPDIGLNHAVGGVNTLTDRLKYEYDSDTKLKISTGVRRAFLENQNYRESVLKRNKGRVLTDETKLKMSSSRKGKATKWVNSKADNVVWSNADFYYLHYLEMIRLCSDQRLKFSPKVFEKLSGLVVAKSKSLLKSFRSGWVPNEDQLWLDTFKNKKEIS